MSENILIVDDDQSMCNMLQVGLRAVGYAAQSITAPQNAFELIHGGDFDLVITDMRMRGVNGLELCKRVVDSRPDIPVIVVTAFGSMETAIEAMRAGAYDFITKPFELDAIRLTVKRALEHRALSKKVENLEHALRGTREFESILGSSKAMRCVYDLIERVAPSDTAVLVTGESGTGKELVARALHQQSARSNARFVAINCAAMPETLLESELFGYTKGAFTDAKLDRPGLFQQAEGGTLFFDEIGEMPLGLQPKLLRALQEKAVRPVGGRVEMPFDARIIAATNRDLETAVEKGRFREDLYYRIHVIQIDVPPLRARGNDILLLAQHFIRHFSSIAGKPVNGIFPAAAERLLKYPWPGNVRELQNCMERAVTLCRYSEITVEDLPEKVRDYQRPQLILASDDPSELVSMEEVERRYVLRVFESTGQNKSMAAKILGLNRKTLYRKLRCYGAIVSESDADD
ncbi:MAG: sigma-54 dependent transcriptional regulator [Pseudomonadota bacterium]